MCRNSLKSSDFLEQYQQCLLIQFGVYDYVGKVDLHNNNTLSVHQYHEQEIPEVIPIEGIPLSNQLNTNQIKLN